MPDREARLADLALSVSDGTPVDWQAAESSAASDSERRQIRDLQSIERMAFGSTSAVLAPAPPEAWGPLRVIERIGRGRFGEVYRAWDPRLAREVALKFLRHADAGDDDPDVVDEGRLLARVRHPNVVTVYGAERLDGRVGLWMELVRGQTLEELVSAGPLPALEAAAIVANVARALEAVHAAGLVHRDVKAQNVMRADDGRILLMDFGTGRELMHDGEAELAGTPLYLAPEVLEGASGSPVSDVYSAGVLFYRLLTARFPVEGRTLSDVRAAHRRDALREAMRRLTGVPPALRVVVRRALAADPSDRFSTAGAMADALDAASDQPSPNAWWRRAGMIALLTLGGLGAVAAASSWLSKPTTTATGGSSSGSTSTICDDCGMMGPPSVSPDGRHMAFVDATSLDIVIRDLASGATSPLHVFDGAADSAVPVLPALSADARRVAYFSASNEGAELRVATVGGPVGQSEPVDTGGVQALPLDWSPDGQSILAAFMPGAGTVDLTWVSVETGQREFVARVDDVPGMITARVSPDGRWIAYGVIPQRRAGRPAPTTGVRVLSLEHPSESHRLTNTEAIESNPVWSADGRTVYFTSDTAGSADLWAVPVTDGAPRGVPVLVRRGIGASMPIRSIAGGQLLLFENQDGIRESTVVSLQSETTPARRFVGSRPLWSPDGQALALVRREAGGAAALAIQPADGSPDRVYRPDGLGADAPLWFAGGRAVLVRIADDGEGFWSRLDLETTEVAPLIRNRGNPELLTHWGIRALGPDSTLYFGAYASAGAGAPLSRIVAVDLNTGKYRDVVTVPGDADSWPRTAAQLSIAVRPDGEELALYLIDPTANMASVWAVSRTGADLRRLCDPFPAPEGIPGLEWSPDGRTLYFAERGTGRETTGVSSFRIMSLDANGGAPVFTGFETPGWVDSFSISPDGRQIAFDGVPTTGARQSVWSLLVK